MAYARFSDADVYVYLDCYGQGGDEMSEEIKERARASAARILGTTPGCSTCLTVGQRLAHQRAMHEGFVEETREGWRADADTIARLTRELDEARERIVALEAQLATRGACQCGDDEVCALARRAQEAERERDMARAEAEVLRGVGCEEQKEGEPQSGRCGVCIKCAQAERDEAQRRVTALTEGLRLVSDALDRLDQIYRADIDLLGDPPVETPAWLREARHRAVALLTPTNP